MYKKSIEVWNSDSGYLVPETPEIKSEVAKVMKIWKESNALCGYCPNDKEQKMREYKNDNFEIGMVTEHTGVEYVSLYMKYE